MSDTLNYCRGCGKTKKEAKSYCQTCRATTDSQTVPTDCEQCGRHRHLTKDFKACCAVCDHNCHPIVNSLGEGKYQDHIIEAENGLIPGLRNDLEGQTVAQCPVCEFQDTRPIGYSEFTCFLCGYGANIPMQKERPVIEPNSIPDQTCPICSTVWHFRGGDCWCDHCHLTRDDILLGLYNYQGANVKPNYGNWGETDKGEPPCAHLLALRKTIDNLDIFLVGSIASHTTQGKVIVWCNQCNKRYTVSLAHPFMDNNGKVTCKCSVCSKK